MAVFDLGDAVALRHEVRDADGNLTNATVALTVTAPGGGTSTPVVTNTSTGIYDAAAFITTDVGLWTYRWDVSGALTDTVKGSFFVALQGPSSYVTVSYVKSLLGKLTSDDRDDLIAQSCRSASRLIDRRCGRRFWADVTASARTFDTSRAYHDGRGYVLLVDDIADSTGLAITIGGVTASTLVAEPVNAAALGRPVTLLRAPAGVTSNPFTADAIVTARWGWPYVPDEVTQAAGLLASRLYRRRDSPQGVIGSAEWGAMRVGRVDPDVEALISPFILPGFA